MIVNIDTNINEIYQRILRLGTVHYYDLRFLTPIVTSQELNAILEHLVDIGAIYYTAKNLYDYDAGCHRAILHYTARPQKPLCRQEFINFSLKRIEQC